MRWTRLVLLLVGVVLLGVVIAEQDPAAIAACLRRGRGGLLAVLPVFVLHLLVRAAALQRCLPPATAVGLPWLAVLRVAGEAVEFLTGTGPALAEPTKAWLLTRRGLSVPAGFSATIAEYLANVIVGAVMLAVAAVYLLAGYHLGPGLRTGLVLLGALGVVFVAVAAAAFWRRIYLIGAVIGRLRRLPGLRRSRHLAPDGVRRFEDGLFAVFRDDARRLAGLLGLEALAHLLLVAELAVILGALGVPSPAGDAFLIESATKFVPFAFFFIPAQLGAAEGVAAALVVPLGLPGSVGVAAVLVRRLRSLAVALLGLAALGWLPGHGRDTAGGRPSR